MSWSVAREGALSRLRPRPKAIQECSHIWRDTVSGETSRRWRLSVETDVFEIQRIIVDAAQRWSNPVCEFSRLGHAASHEGLHEFIILRARQPFEFVFLPRFFGKHFAVDAYEVTRKISNFAMESLVRQGQAESDSGLIDDPLPAADAVGYLVNIVGAQAFIQGCQGGNTFDHDFSANDL